MRGKAVLYPMGWDDNGLPTERRVQNYYGVRCDPSLPYDPSFVAPEKPGKQPISVSRPNFIELCARLTAEDEKAFEHLWRFLGLSVEWSRTYATIDRRAQKVSQTAFLRLLRSGAAYQLEAPTLWDVDFRSAVAQAELEDRERPGAYHRIRFARPGGQYVEIETTRPELIPACVALVAHPDDERYKPLFGTDVLTPLFNVPVPVKAHPLADPEKGSGIAMICTFGDLTDVTWWRELSLPVRAVIMANGALRPLTWGGDGWETRDASRAQASYDQLANLSAEKARVRIVEMLRESGDLIGDPRPITHPVKFYEKGDRPLEIVTSRQWFIKTMEFRPHCWREGTSSKWHPEYMRVRYENWVNGLAGDWCVSRQRFFGVPFPVWYPIRADGTVDYERRLLPEESRLPIDPSTDASGRLHRGAAESARRLHRRPGHHGHVGHLVRDAANRVGVARDPAFFGRVFPMDLRPQAHDIIRTWLFDTVLRAHLEHDSLPWRHAALSGWVLDPDRKKMSKSKGNVVTPMALLEDTGLTASVLVGKRPSRDRHGIRRSADEGGPASLDQAAERRQICLDAGRAARADRRTARSRHADQPEPAGARRHGAARGLRLRVGAREDRALLLGLLRRLSRAREVATIRRLHGGRCRVREQCHARGAVDDVAAVRAVSAVCDRGSVVVVAAGFGAPGELADSCRSRRVDW